MDNKTNTIDFLKIFYPDYEQIELFLTLYTLPNKKSKHVPLSQINKIQGILEDNRLKQHCYFGVGLKNRDLGPSIAGDASSVVAFPGLGADVDIKGPGHKQNDLPETLADAIALAYSIAGFPPSIIVFSGGGIQPYWLFKELWAFDTPEERKQAEALLKGFGNALIQQGALKGYKIDNVFDLARKFRLPGTHNIKNPHNPIMAMVIESHDDRRYNPDDFDVFVDRGSSIDIEKSSYDREYSKDCNYEPANFELIRNSCEFIRHFEENAKTLSEPEWYDGLTIVSRCIDGMKLAHELSKHYPNYTAEETEKKVNQALSKTGPMLCSTIRSRYPTICSECTHDIMTPLHLGRKDQLNDRQDSSANTKDKSKKYSVEKILELVKHAEFFMKDSSEEVYVRFEVDKHKETWPVRSIRFKRWITFLYEKIHKTHFPKQSLYDAIDVIESKAQYKGHYKTIHIRVARHNDLIYIDLCDKLWRAIEISGDAWKIVNDPPVVFRRTPGMLPLPNPERNGSFEPLRALLNMDEPNFIIAVGWLIGALNPDAPFPILVLSGAQGSGKSTACKILRNTIDPSEALLRSLPKKAQDLMISAENSLILGYDNVSTLPEWLSDALCRISTGSGDSYRELYTDKGEVIFSAKKPIMINSITNIGSRHDFLDRTMICNIGRIREDKRCREALIWKQLDESHPSILGAICDAVSTALANENNVEIELPPRMADFAFWVAAAEPSLPWNNGKFYEVYMENINKTITMAIESDPVAWTIIQLVAENERWEGTPTDLHKALQNYVSDETQKSPLWPDNIVAFGKHLKRVESFLHGCGYAVEETTKDGQRWKCVYQMERSSVRTEKQVSF